MVRPVYLVRCSKGRVTIASHHRFLDADERGFGRMTRIHCIVLSHRTHFGSGCQASLASLNAMGAVPGSLSHETPPGTVPAWPRRVASISQFDSHVQTRERLHMGVSELVDLWPSPGVPSLRFYLSTGFTLTITLIHRGHGAWLSFRREKVPGTAPITFLVAWLRADGATLGSLRTGGDSEGRR